MKIRKAIIPVAGLGTRFLPATKAQPKEMLTLVDKPVIQYIVEDAVAAGIEQIIFVTSQTKRAIEDHFDHNFELETRLREKGKDRELTEVRHISELASFAYIRQKNPLGDGHAILMAKDFVGDEPCVVLFGDVVVQSEIPCVKQMLSVFDRYQDPVIAVQRVPRKEISKYGVVAGRRVSDRTYEVSELVEKPKPAEAPSDLAIIGRYIITPEVFRALEQAQPSVGGEIRLIDAFRALQGRRSIYAYDFEGRWYDCGDKLQFLVATVDYGLQHAEVNKDGAFESFLRNRVKELARGGKQAAKNKKKK